MWLGAFSPSVVFLALGADADPAGVVLGWVPAAMQEAGDGTQVPCGASPGPARLGRVRQGQVR